MSVRQESRCVLYTCASERDNPFDRSTHPSEHAAWRDAYRAMLEDSQRHNGRCDDSVLKEDAGSAQGQCQFALVWRPYVHPFRLRVHDVVRVDGNRLGRVIRVTECAAVVVFNPPVRAFKTRFDKEVRFQPSAVTVRIAADSETEVLNRKIRRQRRHAQPERRGA